MVGCKLIIRKKKKPSGDDWLTTLLKSQFFDPCIQHLELKKNEKNVFCMDCNIGFCRNCEDDRLQICKYVYHDVVRFQDMQKHLDCSKIQTYKINGEKAVHLNPRPQLKDAKPSTKSKTGGSCEGCGRYIQELPNRFCSIACKLCVVPLSPNNNNEGMMMTIPVVKYWNPESSNNTTSDKESSLTSDDNRGGGENPTFRPPPETRTRTYIHKRKGIPRRAHLVG